MSIEQAIVAPEAEPHRHLLTVNDFVTLHEAGAFDGLGRVELINGEIFVMAPLYFPHAQVHADLTIDVGDAVRSLGRSLRVLNPVSAALDEHNLPETDIVVIEAEGFEGTVITADMVRLIIEVSASSLRHDLGPKLRLYARTSIPEYWVADVAAKQIVRLHAPYGEQFLERATFAFGDLVPSATIPGLTVDTARLR